jgi:homogentisate 1,2-dioxygenase
MEYNSGFGSHFATEALPEALPKGQNNPQVCNYGLYAEQLSGTAFTAPRAKNLRSWLYRIRPTVGHSKQTLYDNKIGTDDSVVTPDQLRWAPLALEDIKSDCNETKSVDFVDSLRTMGSAGDPLMHEGLAIHMFFFNKNMTSSSSEALSPSRVFQSSDGDMLIVPQSVAVSITTEFGKLEVEPQEIIVIPRGITFKVDFANPSTPPDTIARGYILEIYKGHFELPNLGPIGANGLANPRDFLYPVAAFEDIDTPHTVINKFGGELFLSVMDHSPFDVVAWHGNYAPYKYDLRLFCTMNSVSFDHPDPSIYTVLTCPSSDEGTALADFVIFPPRFMVMDKSFRPPYYHRNCMTEFMGMVYGKYDAKEGFAAGGASLHSCMSAHGPDKETFIKASRAKLEPIYFDGGLAFMFETCFTLKVTKWALNSSMLESGYQDCWNNLPKLFTGEKEISI